jgi:hypothetical protein
VPPQNVQKLRKSDFASGLKLLHDHAMQINASAQETVGTYVCMYVCTYVGIPAEALKQAAVFATKS